VALVLQFIGALVVAFFILLGIGVGFLFFKLRKLKGQITQMATHMGGLAVPVSIELIPEDSPDWKNARQVEDWTTVVKSQGFMPAGEFRLAMQQGSLARGFVHANGESMAAICEFGNGQVWLDYVQFGDDDFTLTATNVDAPFSANDPPWKTSVRAPKASPEELFKRFCEARLDNPKLLTVSDFKVRFEEGFRRAMEWQYTSGNISVDHIEELAGLTGLSVDPKTQEFFCQHGLQGEADEEDEQQVLINRYLEESGILASDWEKIEDDVIVITETMTQDLVVSFIEYHLDIDDVNEISDRLQGKSGSELFWAILQTAGKSDRFKLIFHLNNPEAQVIQFV
jgi:hypothetical protein